MHTVCCWYVCSVMKNAKVLSERLKDARDKVMPRLQREVAHVNVQFRTMDKDINTVRPLLMKLQREKDHYTRCVVCATSTLSFSLLLTEISRIAVVIPRKSVGQWYISYRGWGARDFPPPKAQVSHFKLC